MFWYWLRSFFISNTSVLSNEDNCATESNKGIDYHFKIINEVQEDFTHKCVYILNEGYIDEALYFICPCGCDSIIELNLLEDSKPLWKYNIDNKKITISPSVWRKIGCKSHFFIRTGKVHWAKD